MQQRVAPRPRSRISCLTGSVAAIVFVMGAINILSAWVGIEHSRLAVLYAWLYRYLPLEVHLHRGTRTLTVMAGLLLMVLSWSLWRRKRQGWIAAVGLLALSAVLHLVKGLDVEEATLALLVLGVLVAARRQFQVRSDTRSIPAAVGFSLAVLVGCVLYGLTGFFLLRAHFTPAFTPARALRSTVAVMTQTGTPPLRPQLLVVHPHTTPLWYFGRITHHSSRHTPVRQPDREAVWFIDSLAGIMIFSVLYVAGALLRPVVASLSPHGRERDEVHRLLLAAGGPPLAYWTLLPGLHYLFSEDRRAVIAYRMVGDVAIALGDPLGHPEAIPTVITAFADLCLTNDWRPCWYQTTARWLACYRQHGWAGMKIGEEALVELAALRFTGKKWQDVRTALNRLPREQYTAVWYDLADDPQGWSAELADISTAWLAGREEKEFSLGTWANLLRHAEEQRVLVLVTPDGCPAAFLSFVPIFGVQGGWALDLMRRRGELPAGAMSFLLATALQTFREEGAQVLSLSLSPLADVTTEEAAGAPELLERIRGLVYEHFSRMYNFKGLHLFKEKFQPRWEPRYLIYPTLGQLPRVLVALMRAHAPYKRGGSQALPPATTADSRRVLS